jgi:hypothetical protein
MRIQIILLLALLACGVGQAQVRNPVPIPNIQTIGEGVVWRISENKDEHGSFLPPWKEIRITNIFEFKRRPAIGNKVTVIPLAVDIPPLDLRILKAEEKENACDESMPDWWEVELEPIKLKEFFEIAPILNRAAEYPFDVAIIYPAVKVARQMKKDQLTRAMLPKGVSINTVKAAIDLTGDRKPEVVIVEYCCGRMKKPADECDYTCGKTFKRLRNAWKLVDTSAPC